MREVIITGATGFVGLNLNEYLKESFDLKNLSVRYIPNQKFDLNADAIIHLAGKAHDLKKVSSPQDYYDANFELTKQLFDSFLESDASLFVFMSTVKAVADIVDGVLTEEDVPNPKTHYGKAKHQAELYILSQKLPESKRVYILRPCMIHGPGNKGNLNLLYQLVRKGIPYPLGAFENKRSFLSVENLCFSIVELLKQQPNSAIFNLADDEAIPTTQLITIIAETLHKTPKIVAVPKKLIHFFAKLNTLLKLPFSEEKLQKLTESYVVDASKIKKNLNIQFPVSTEEGLVKTIKSFQQ